MKARRQSNQRHAGAITARFLRFAVLFAAVLAALAGMGGRVVAQSGAPVAAASGEPAPAAPAAPGEPAAAMESIGGEWWTPGFRSRVRVFDCAGLVCAEIVWLWDTRVAQIHDRVLFDLRAAKDGSWQDGRAFNPADGNTYNASARLLAPDRLLIEGCVLFLCQEQVWLRVGTLDKVPHRVQPTSR